MRYLRIFVFTVIFCLYYNISFSQNDGLREIVKSQQNKLISVEKSLKNLIGKIENKSSGSEELKKLINKISEIKDNLRILDSKIQTLNKFAYKLEFEINRIQSHLNLSSSSLINQKKENIKPQKPKNINNQEKISKQGLESKSNGVLGYIKDDKKKAPEQKQTEKNLDTKKIEGKTVKKNNILLPNKDPEEQFKISLNYTLTGDYEKAEKAFKEFIEVNKDHKRAQDAQYWLGRVYFTRKKYEEAAIALAEYNSIYPDDKRFQETTLLIAESAANFAPKDQLCEILTQSLEFMVNPTENFSKSIKKLKNKNNCPN